MNKIIEIYKWNLQLWNFWTKLFIITKIVIIIIKLKYKKKSDPSG